MSTTPAISLFEDYQPPRILIVDDNPRIHRDFELVLLGEEENFELDADAQRVYGLRMNANAQKSTYVLDHAHSGLEAIEKVKESRTGGRFYQLAFVDVRMANLDGVATIERIWQIDPNMQMVICTAYADYSEEDLVRKLGQTDKLLVLKKPFDSIEVTQMARTLTQKWHLARQAALRLEQMELLVSRRTQKVLDLQRRESERLQELDEMKLRFLNNLTIEFRKPLTLIVDLLEQMLACGKTDRQQQGTMHRNARRMLFLVDQLQDCRDLEMDEFKFEPAESDLAALIRGVVRRFQPVADRQKVKLQFQSNEEHRLAWVDANKLESVFSHLVSQALVFTPENGRISVFAHFSSSGARIMVEDNGTPIARADLPFTFDSFYQPVGRGDGGGERRFGSVLTQTLVQLHGGNISVESLIGGAGSSAEQPETRFTILLPMERPARQTPASPSDAQVQNQPPTQPDQSSPSGSIAGESAGTKSPLVLIVENHTEAGVEIRQVLGREFGTLEARDGQTGLKKAQEFVPDLIIVDIFMPQIDGIDFCRALRAAPLTSHIPVILLSNQDQEDYQLKALEAGADECVTQPRDLSTLKARVENLLESRRKLRPRFDQDFSLQPRELAVNRADAQFLQRAIAVIEQNMSDFEFDVDALARSVAVSRRQLFRKLKAVTDTTPKAFIRSVRLKRAAQLLIESEMTVTEITFAVGFQDVKHFRTLFKEQFGVLPSDYIKASPGSHLAR